MKIGSAHWHHSEPDELFGERTHAFWDGSLPPPKKKKRVNPHIPVTPQDISDAAGTAPTDVTYNPDYYNPDGTPVAPGVAGPPAPPPLSKTEILEKYRASQEEESGTEEDEEGRKKKKEDAGPPSLAAALIKAENKVKAAEGRETRLARRWLEQGGPEPKKSPKAIRREDTKKINETTRPVIDSEIERLEDQLDHFDPGASNRKTSREAARVADREALVDYWEDLRDNPKRQKGRDLLAANMSQEDWKMAREEGLAPGTPWKGKKTDKQRRNLARRLVRNDRAFPATEAAEQAARDAANPIKQLDNLLGVSTIVEGVGEDVTNLYEGARDGGIGGLLNARTENELDVTPEEKVAALSLVPIGGTAFKAAKGARAAVGGGRAAAAAGETAVSVGKAAVRATNTGKRIKRYRRAMEQPVRKGGKVTRQQVARDARKGAWMGAAGYAIGSGQAENMIEGTLQANVGDAGKATIRSLVGLFAAPLTIGTALGVSGKRALEAGMGADHSGGEIVGPTRELGKAYASEFQRMMETYWGGSAEEIKEMTEDDYGYLGPLNATVMTGAAFRGVGGPALRSTIGKVPYKPGEHGYLDGPTLNELHDRAVAKGKATVINTRALASKDVAVKTATGKFEKSRKILNREKYAAVLRPLKEWNDARRKDKATGGEHHDVDIATIAIFPLLKGLGSKLDRATREKLLHSDQEMSAAETDILVAAGRLPDSIWDPSTPVGKQIARMQKSYEKDIHPYLTKGEMDLETANALKLESLVTVEQKTRGEYLRGEREDIQAAPEHPNVRAENEYMAQVKANKNAIKKHQKRDEPKVKKKEEAAKQASEDYERRSTGEQRAAALRAQIGQIRANESRRALTTKEKRKVKSLSAQMRKAEFDASEWKRMSHADREQQAARVRAKQADAVNARRKHTEEGARLQAEASRLGGNLTDEELAELRREANEEADLIENPEAHIEQFRAENKLMAERLPADSEDLLRHTKRLEDLEDLIAQRKAEDKAPDAPPEVLASEIYSRMTEEEMKLFTGNRQQRVEAQRRMGEIDRELRAQGAESRRRDREGTTDLRTELFQKKAAAKSAEKRRLVEEALLKEAQTEFDRLFFDRMEEHAMTVGLYAPYRPRPGSLPEEVRTSGSGQVRIPETHQRRHADLAKQGNVDRRIDSIIKAVHDKAEREKNRMVASYVERNGMYSRINDRTGKHQLYFTPDELEQVMTDKLRREYVLMDEEIFLDPSATVQGPGGKKSSAWQEGWRDPGAEKLSSDKRYALVEKGMADRIKAQEQEVGKVLEFIGRWSSKLTLGTSLGWALTQPFAETLTLLASHPNPAAFRRAWLARQEILRADPEAASLLRYASGTTLGTDVVTTARLRNYDATGRAVRQMKDTPEGEMIRKIMRLEALGDIDRWKGAAIRELGALMEIERNLKGSVRAAKATWGQMDAIEKIADKLAPMTQAERLRYMYSAQGIRDAELLTRAQADALRAGEKVIENVDRQQGNWTAVRPGLEQNLASVMFFYPFTRFSLNWTFRTYPADHPARYAVLTTLGAFQANMIEDILGMNPDFIKDWAQVPVYDEEGKIVALVPVSRLQHSSNAMLETLGGLENPQDFAAPFLPPLAAAANAYAGIDQYGDKLTGADGESEPTWADRGLNFMDQLASLSPVYRELKRQGATVGPNSILGKLGINVGFSGPRQAQVGDDPDGVRSFFRRQFGPIGDFAYAIATGNDPGLPADSVRIKALNSSMWTAYIEGGMESDADLSPKAKKAKERAEEWDKSLYGDAPTTYIPGKPDDTIYWQAELKNAEERFGEWDARTLKVKAAFNREQRKYVRFRQNNPGYKAYRREQSAKDDAALKQESAAYTLVRLAKMQGVDPPKLEEAVLERGRELHQGRRVEQPLKVYDMESGEYVIKGSRADIGDFDENFHRANIQKGARAWGHRGNLQNLAFEQPDGSFTKPGDEIEGIMQDAFEGIPGSEFGGQGLDPAKLIEQINNFQFASPQAERAANRDKGGLLAKLGIPHTPEQRLTKEDLDLQNLRIPVVKNPGKVPPKRKMKVANNILRLKEELQASTGGVPAKVPAKYKPAVAKWGAWLEKQMRKNGLVEKDDSFRGAGLPASMSGPEYLAKIIQAESNWDASAASDVASGLGQFIPSTREALMERTGTDAWSSDPEEQVRAVAELLSGSVPDFDGTMDHYNPGFPDSGDNPYGDGTWRYYFDQDVGPVRGGGKPNPKIARALIQQIALGKQLGIYDKPNVSNAPVKLSTAKAGTDLKGVNRPVKGLAKYLARSIGETGLEIMSGKSNHSPLTVNGTPSEHGAGNALDIYAYMDGYEGGDKKSQARGDRIAMNAIVALGGSPKQAKEFIANGRGLFNAPNGQVIWGQDSPAVGGNHLDHVHVSAHKLNREWLPPKGESTKTVDKLPGPWQGARTMVRQITGAPQIRGDHAYIEGLGGQRDENMHTGEGHNAEYGYAQDINYENGRPDEGEPPFTQETVDTIVKNLRSMGADVGDLVLGQDDWSGQVGSYEVNLLTKVHGTGPHIHIDAIYRGGGGTPTGGMMAGMSFMERAKANRYGSPSPSSNSGYSGGGGGYSGGGGGTVASSGSGGSGQAPAAGAAWSALQDFRVGVMPGQKVPLWGGSASPSDGKSELPMLAESISQGLKVPRPSKKMNTDVQTRSTAGKLGLSTFTPTTTKRKKRNLA